MHKDAQKWARMQASNIRMQVQDGASIMQVFSKFASQRVKLLNDLQLQIICSCRSHCKCDLQRVKLLNVTFAALQIAVSNEDCSEDCSVQ